MEDFDWNSEDTQALVMFSQWEEGYIQIGIEDQVFSVKDLKELVKVINSIIKGDK